MNRFASAVLAALLLAFVAAPASAHSYTDPALRTVLDGVQPSPLPPGASVAVVPSVVDQLVVSNSTATVLEVEALGGEPFLRVSSAGVLANLASPDWWSTGTPEGGVPPPADVQRDRGKGAPRWALVSRGTVWGAFDTRLHPPVEASAAQRAAGKDAVLTTWRVPLRYGATALAATGHVSFTPVRGALQVAVTRAPAGVTATALQGELPGLFLRTDRDVVVTGRDEQPFLRFRGGVVEANTASASWVDDQRARGRSAPRAATSASWTRVGTATTYSWLDQRLRFPSDVPDQDVLAKRAPTVVQRWRVPLTVDGVATALEGTVTWVPRAVGVAAVAPSAQHRAPSRRWWLVGGLAAALLGATALWRFPRGRRAHR